METDEREEWEPTLADVFYSPECQEYAQVLDDEIAIQMAWPEVHARFEAEYDVAREEGWQRMLAELRAMPYAAYLRSGWWAATRRAALERAEYACLLCDATERLEVHHRTYVRRPEELPRDLVVLCHECHARHHGKLEDVHLAYELIRRMSGPCSQN